MLYNIGVTIVSALVLATIGYIWEKKYMDDIQDETQKKAEATKEILQKEAETQYRVSVLMSNSDDSISDALEYIKPSSHLIRIVEKIK